MHKIIFALLLLPALAQAAPDMPAVVGKVCINCHTRTGNSESPLIPKLAGQQAGYLETQLMAYREQSRKNAAAQNYMWGIAHLLSDEEIHQVAAWYAAQQPPTPIAAPSKQSTELGSNLFAKGKDEVLACATCHGEHAQGSEAGPRLAGQHAAYIRTQLKVLKTNQRPGASFMQTVAPKLSDDEIDSLALYVQSLP